VPRFFCAIQARKRLSLQPFKATYSIENGALEPFKNNGTITFEITPDDPDFGGYYAAHLDKLELRFNGIR